MDDIARLAGVSKPTVSRVMNGSPLVTEETRERVLKVARQHGYEVNESARRLWQQRANTIAVVMDLPSMPGQRISQPFHFELLADTIKALNSVHQDVLLISPENERPESYERKIASRTVDGIIFLGQGTRLGLLRELALTSAPFVAWGAPDPTAAYCAVGSDNALGGRLAAQRFFELGRQRVVFVGPLEHNEIRLRRHGLALELQAARRDVQLADVVPADLAFSSSQEAFSAYLDAVAELPDAVFCASDTIAMAVLAVLRAKGIRVPDEVSVIGYDDIPGAEHAAPAITTIRQDTALAGALLVENLQKRIAGEFPLSTMMPTSLIVRET